MPPSLADPQGSPRAALTPGWSRDVDGGGRVVVAIVPAPQELCSDPQSARPAQGLNTSNLQQRHLPALSSQVSTTVGAQKAEVLARVRQDPKSVPWGQPAQNGIPFQWSSTSFSAQAHPDNFYQYK